MADTQGYYQGIANRVRMDMDSRSPRLRLTTIGGLLEAGYRPDSDERWFETVEKIVEYVGAEMDNFADAIATLRPPPTEGEKDPNISKADWETPYL